MVNEVGNLASLPVSLSLPKALEHAPASSSGSGRVIHLRPDQFSQATSLSLFSRISASVEQREVAAIEVRQAQSVLGDAGEVLSRIESNLQAIVKQYPPYGLENTERIQYLNAITGLRKQLDALSFPAEKSSSAESELPLPKFPKSGDLSIPELDPKRSTDEQVASALDVVQGARKMIVDIQQSMWEDVAKYASTQDEKSVQGSLQAVKTYVAGQQGYGIGVSVRDILSSGA